ncbi:MAG: hypothetical protein D6731_01530 [Planctomycetota bacterium]|nr:MAG: hypothetical protein D6731_01530 [Planctomycetota bacterium]
MLKAADALTDFGYEVEVVSVSRTPWASEADRHLVRTRPWRWREIVLRRDRAPLRAARAALRQRFAELVTQRLGPVSTPRLLLGRAAMRGEAELARALRASRCDLVYAGTGSALLPVARTARCLGIPYALDLEDFHPGERAGAEGLWHSQFMARVLREALPGAAFRTGGSQAIARAYEERYGLPVTPLHNVFPLPAERPPRPVRELGAPLRLYWFSQTVGPDRGLEDVLEAARLGALQLQLTLRGVPARGYRESLSRQAAMVAGLDLRWEAPASPEDMIRLCAEHDVGLGLERREPKNKDLCLSNKVLTYVAAGMPLVLTDTRGQRPIAADLGRGSLLYPSGDAKALAEGLRRWSEDPASLSAAAEAVWQAARRRWRWDHELEREALRRLVEGVVGAP